MFENLYPGVIFQKATDVSFEFLRQKGVKGLIIDIDNTIVRDRWDCPEDGVTEWIDDLAAAGVKVFVLSNGSRGRVEHICGILKTCGLHKAAKPSRKGFRRALNEMELDARETAVIGDQLFTDILGANKAGMLSILVAPVSTDENPFVRIKRIFEKPILKRYHKNKMKQGDESERTY